MIKNNNIYVHNKLILFQGKYKSIVHTVLKKLHNYDEYIFNGKICSM